MIIRGDAHFPYKALWEVRNAFRKIIFVKFYNGEIAFEGASKVLFDMRKAGRLAAGYLLENNFRKLVFLTQEPAKEAIRRKHGISSKLFDMDILDGIEDACREYGADFYNSGRIIARNIPYHEHENEVKNEINAALDAGCNGFVCMNDIRALSVYQAVAERGLIINKDVSIVSHFNTSLCESLTPKLTSVDMNIPTLIEGVAAAVNSASAPGTIYVEPKLIKRK
ncbi:MAG: substrate-binding domain-containing protein [Lentisphaeria bacterium]|nr:substrate-binding domain-containing protein [Lentisphaeria bacterium]